MANVQHSALTGSSLHEPKGVAAASANRVYLSNGSGSGSWTTVPSTALDSTAASFQNAVVHCQERSIFTLTQGANNRRQLDTLVTNALGGVTALSTNLLTLAAGTYWCEAYCSLRTTNGLGSVYNVQSYLKNETGGANVIYGNGATIAPNMTLIMPVVGRFVLSVQSNISLNTWVFTSGGGDAVVSGIDYSAGAFAQPFSQLVVWKTA